MLLDIGQTVTTQISHRLLKVEKYLGFGSQAEIYLVSGQMGYKALKWYNPLFATSDQEISLRKLISKGAPIGAMKIFLWPEDIAKSDSKGGFGYIMPLIDKTRFAELGEVQERIKPVPNLDVLAKISYLLVAGFRDLHIQGYCFRDISAGNILFDPISGDVLICDTDNIGVDQHSNSEIRGTIEYMAPEVILGKADPSRYTDLHSLAIFLFKLWVWHHPFHGKQQYKIHCYDRSAKKKIYGENPVFVFNTFDKSNELPDDPNYFFFKRMWNILPYSLKNLFITTFSDGLNNPKKRIVETVWMKVFEDIQDSIVICPTCKAMNIWDLKSNIICWNDNQTIPHPPKLLVDTLRGSHVVLLIPNAKLYARHLFSHNEYLDEEMVVGEIVQELDFSAAWGIKNCMNKPCIMEFPDMYMVVAPGKIVPVQQNVHLRINELKLKIVG